MAVSRKDNSLLRDLLFERVYALSVRGFTRQFGRAEVGMRFSLKQDLFSLTEFLHILMTDGQRRPPRSSNVERSSQMNTTERVKEFLGQHRGNACCDACIAAELGLRGRRVTWRASKLLGAASGFQDEKAACPVCANENDNPGYYRGKLNDHWKRALEL